MKLRIKESANNDRAYLYIMPHGIGPGTLPKDVYVMHTETYNGRVLAWLSRFLTTSELNEYGIYPETQLRDRLGDDAYEYFTSMNISARD